MTFFKNLVCCFAVLMLAALPASAQKAARAAVEIKLATLAPEGSTWMKTMHKIDDDVRKQTENRVGFKFFPGGVQGDEKDVIRKIRNGQVHGAGFTGLRAGQHRARGARARAAVHVRQSR
jgi:TRAP-type C4-dicarboxylate transport system substrate-binding protein